ncbi:PREDICTED: uncharacterized protein LOC105361610 [Ceratosolen solmsi marchali]|uniref:Uncharacterized protein LOC105361610 n=1 Tax=Ceratosolen solmsi marchali TaxID=326594 RepID=A0AAJ6YFK4_9HYME|nr:PREDICTED: uncharacterized protein LOC105361610 [Ceratosolen solmsi marchali]
MKIHSNHLGTVMTNILSKLRKDYEYFKKPAGQDPMGKLIGSTYFIMPVFFFAISSLKSVLVYNNWQMLNMISYWVVPISTMILTCTSVTFASAYLRKKDDTLNHYFGGNGLKSFYSNC